MEALRRRVIWLSLIVAVVMLVSHWAACGGGDDDDREPGLADDDDGPPAAGGDDDATDDDAADDDAADDDSGDDDTGDDDTGDDDDDDEEVIVDSQGLLWQVGGLESAYWGQAVAYCQDLTWTSLEGWRLPTVNEFRNIMNGCEATAAGGACDITDSCLFSIDCGNADCAGCASGAGPAGGCYAPADFGGDCGAYWTGIGVDGNTQAWTVDWALASVEAKNATLTFRARCVRPVK